MRLLVAVVVCCVLVDGVHQHHLVRVPRVGLLPAECVYGPVPQSSRLEEGEGGVVRVVHSDGTHHSMPSSCVSRSNAFHGPAWRAWAQFNRTEGLTLLNSTWNPVPVPLNRLHHDPLIYLWNGVEPAPDSDNLAVLQPVLQYGSGPAGASSATQWALACWYVSAGAAVFSELIPVNVHDQVVGSISKPIGANTTHWLVSGDVSGGRTTTLKYVTQRPSFNYGYIVLETYYSIPPFDCVNDYPSSPQLFFGSIAHDFQGRLVPTPWVAQNIHAECNEKAVVTGSNVTILFHH